MALAVTIVFTIEDDSNDSSSTRIRVPTGFSISQYQEFALGAATLMASLCAGHISSANVCVELDISGITGNVVAAGLRYLKGLFNISSDTQGFGRALQVPTFDSNMFIDDSDAIDLADADVAAFIDALEVGLAVTGGTIQPQTDRGHDFESVDSGYKSFRRSA